MKFSLMTPATDNKQENSTGPISQAQGLLLWLTLPCNSDAFFWTIHSFYPSLTNESFHQGLRRADSVPGFHSTLAMVSWRSCPCREDGVMWSGSQNQQPSPLARIPQEQQVWVFTFQGICTCFPNFRLCRMIYTWNMFQNLLCSDYDCFQITQHHHTCDNTLSAKISVCGNLYR